jgi:type I restriction enzyme S subunit
MSIEVLGWQRTTLGEVAEIVGGSTPSKAESRFWDDGTVAWATPSDVTRLPAGVFQIEKTASCVTEDALVSTSLRLLPPGSVLMTSRATIGYPVINAVPMTTNQGFANFLPNDCYHPEFLAQWIIHQRPTLERMAGGSTFPEISKKSLRSVEIYLPPISDQRRIAEILSSVDETIQATQVVNDQTRKVKHGILKRLLAKGINHTQFKQTEIGEIPEQWTISTVGAVCSSVSVGIASSATHAYCDKGVPLLRNQNIKAGHLDLSDLLFVSEDYDRSNASKRVKVGDVVSMRTGYPGRSAVIPQELDGCQTFTTLISRPQPEVIAPAFLCHWINSDAGMAEVRKRQAGGAQQNLNAGVLKGLPVPLPPLSEQIEIAKILDSFPAEDTGTLETLYQMKAAIMSDLLTGRKRVSEDLPVAAE